MSMRVMIPTWFGRMTRAAARLCSASMHWALILHDDEEVEDLTYALAVVVHLKN